jgi:hypothetical protein
MTITTEDNRKNQTLSVGARLAAKALVISLKPQEDHDLQVGNHRSTTTLTFFRHLTRRQVNRGER